MRLKIALENKKFDVRLVDKHIGEEKITAQDADKTIETLEDDTARGQMTDGSALKTE